MFIKIIHGDSLVVLLNPDCQVKNIMDYLKKKCRLNIKNKIELLPLDENENTPFLYLRQPTEYLSTYVTSRESYVPAYIRFAKNGNVDSVLPQVQNWATRYPDLEYRVRDFLDKKKTKKRDGQAERPRKVVTAPEEPVEGKKGGAGKKEKKKKGGKK